MIQRGRRHFLTSSVGFAASAAMPEWLARAFAIQDSVSTWRTQHLRDAIARARKAEKPLLVLVVPNQNDGDVRGQWFGALLTEWNDASWLLASCEIACATMAELGNVTGSKVAGAPLFVFADVRDAVARTTPIECVLPPVPEDARQPCNTVAEVAQMGVRWMSMALHAGAERHGLSLPTLAEAAVRRLDDSQREEIDAWLRDPDARAPMPELMVLAAAEVWRRLLPLPGRDETRIDTLRSAFVHYCQRAIVGARWMSRGCAGPNVFLHSTKSEAEAAEREWDACGKAEADLQAGKLSEKEFRARFGRFFIACGIGHVDDVCAQFLEFWTAGDRAEPR